MSRKKRNQLILQSQVSSCQLAQGRGCYEHLPASYTQSEGQDGPIVHNPARPLPVGDFSYFTIAKEAAIIRVGFTLIAWNVANYKTAHDDTHIRSKHYAPQDSETEAKGLDVGVEVIVAPTLLAKHGNH